MFSGILSVLLCRINLNSTSYIFYRYRKDMGRFDQPYFRQGYNLPVYDNRNRRMVLFLGKLKVLDENKPTIPFR